MLVNTGFKWSGAGSTMFSNKTNESAAQAAATADDNPEAFEASVDFKPVLENLPELIERRTGLSVCPCCLSACPY